jgi:hypothetical protein
LRETGQIKRLTELIKLVCFAERSQTGSISEAEYQSLYSIAPTVHSAFEALNKAIVEPVRTSKRGLPETRKS